MAFDKITDEDRSGKGNYGQPDTPELTTSDMQLQMDSLPNLAIDKFNDFIDVLNSNKAAKNIGAEVPTGIQAQENVQSILNAMVLNVGLNTQNRHSHSNKAILDTITDEALDSYDRLVTLLDAILSIESSLTNNSAAIPTSAAVAAYVASYDIRTKVLNTAYPVGCVYSTTSTSPTTLFGGTWTLLDTDASGVKRYVRTA